MHQVPAALDQFECNSPSPRQSTAGGRPAGPGGGGRGRATAGQPDCIWTDEWLQPRRLPTMRETCRCKCTRWPGWPCARSSRRESWPTGTKSPGPRSRERWGPTRRSCSWAPGRPGHHVAGHRTRLRHWLPGGRGSGSTTKEVSASALSESITASCQRGHAHAVTLRAGRL